jgi:hypothetical protein
MKSIHSLKPLARAPGLSRWAALTLGALLCGVIPAHGQKIFFEDFESLELGPAVDEAVPGIGWTKTPPPGWVQDDSGVPGIGTALDGRTEWAGWSFANRFWWVLCDNQRRDEFTKASGTVMIADPDEWDDQPHGGSGLTTEERTAQGLWYETYITTAPIDLTGQAANSLVLVFNSSWRPEYDNNYRQTGIIDVTYDDGTPVRIMHWVSDSAQPAWQAGVATPSYKDDNSTNDEIILPLNNPADAGNLKLTFGMFDAGNDWWWAVDNIAIGVPPLVTSISANAYSFTVSIVEALGKTVNPGSVSVNLDGTPLTGVVVTPETGRVLVAYDQYPKVFSPGKKYAVTVRFTANDGRQLEETVEFTGKSYTTVTATPTSVTAVVSEDLTAGAEVLIDDTAGVQVRLDGTAVTPGSVNFVPGKPSTFTINYSQAPTIFESGSSHIFQVTFTTLDGEVVPDAVTFTAPEWTAVPPALGTAIGTGSNPGMRWRTHQLATGVGTSVAGAEAQLAGTHGASIHDPNGHITPEQNGFFQIDWVNFEQAGGNAGRFTAAAAAPLSVPDDLIPGIPGTTASTDNIAAESLAYLELQPGFYSMVVNSDDGFQVSTGNADNPTYLVLGKFDAGRGASDSVFFFNIEEAGVYLFRLLWFEGGGGASVEWFTINADGSAALINGEQTGAIKSFRTRTVPEPALPASNPAEFESIVKNADGSITVTWTGTGVLEISETITNPDWQQVEGATSPYTFAPTANLLFKRIRTGTN